MYITIHTGNILQLSDLKRKPGHTPADEVFKIVMSLFLKFHFDCRRILSSSVVL